MLERHPDASCLLLDDSAGMLGCARELLAGRSEGELVGDLGDPLPDGPFDLVISALAIHHLDGVGKARLFGRVRHALRDGGRFVMGDVVVPDDPADAVTPLTRGFDRPDRVEDLTEWLARASFATKVTWSSRDLVVISAEPLETI